MKLKKLLFLVGFTAMFMGFCQKTHAGNVVVRVVCFFSDGKICEPFKSQQFSDNWTINEVLWKIAGDQYNIETDNICKSYNKPNPEFTSPRGEGRVYFWS
jgi:hypothetical protein